MSRRYLLPLICVAALSCNLISNLPISVSNPEGNSSNPNTILLNEVLFQPVEGQPQFVELINPGSSKAALDGLRLTNEQSQSYALPPSLPALKAGGVLLILFDGLNRVDGTTVHSELNQFLNPDAGSIELTASDGTTLDHVAWGVGQVDTVRLSRGGKISDLVPGTTIGRPPEVTVLDPSQWTVYSPEQATPGAVNPFPNVAVLLPLSGAELEKLPVTLSWYPAPGASQYQVQVATDPSFSSPLIDQTMTDPGLTIPTLPLGDYLWRVQALTAGGGKADYSPISAFSLIQPTTSAGHLADPPGALGRAPLGVRWISQHKDTRMLELEQNRETGAHAWDVDHKALDTTDPADNMNCALASVAMVAQFYGGKLSQDRIGFEIFKNNANGPEWDLNYGLGMSDNQLTKAITFALGAAPTFRPRAATAATMWNDVKKEIDAGRPVIASTPTHAFVITGYTQTATKQLFTINDPWIGPYNVNFNNPTGSNLGNIFDAYWLLPTSVTAKSDEPEISKDSDGDGVVDFDETQRFHTNPFDADTDHDQVKDKADIRASIFDPKHGYALGFKDGRDFDKDGIPMELDEDSDGGGCFDGLEDLNQNGKFEVALKETDNFQKSDDTCLWGSEESVYAVTIVNDNITSYTTTNLTATFSVKPSQGGKLQGLARIKAYNMGGWKSDAEPNAGCPMVTFSGDDLDWGATLKGTFFTQPDKSTQVFFQATPPNGPKYTWAFSGCGPATQEYPGIIWGGLSGKLVNGVFDSRQDNPMPVSGNGIFYTTIHMEQKK